MQGNLVRRISHIQLRFWPRAISLRLSTNNGRHCESPVCHVTLTSTQPKNGNCCDARYISWYRYSSQVDTTIDPNPILYFYCVENVKIWVIWKTIREFVTEKLMRLWWKQPRLRDDISASCQAATWFGWFQHRIHRVALRNVWFDSFVA